MKRQHGVKGVYYGGDWLEIEECAEHFNIDADSASRCHAKCAQEKECPRSASRHQSAKEDGTYDVAIVGAGCIGAAVARELSKYQVSVVLLDSADDVTQGATKGNSGIVHAGYDDTPGSVRAKFCWPGNQMFPQLDKELRFGFQRNGSLVLAFTEAEEKHLRELVERGLKNGVKNLRLLDPEEILEMEPQVSDKVRRALYSPDAGNVIPYEFAIALAENAVDNGVELRLRREVKSIEMDEDSKFSIKADYWEPTSYLETLKEGSAAKPATGFFRTRNLAAMSASLAILAYASSFYSAPTLLAMGVVFFAGTLGMVALRGRGGATDAYVKSEGEGGLVVSVPEMATGGSGSRAYLDSGLVRTETIRATYVINAAGSGADKLANMIGDESFQVKPRIGDYILLHRKEGARTHCTLFPAPDPHLGKGVLVQTTLWGNLILGPTARDQEKYGWTPEEVREYILSRCKKLVPSIKPEEVIHTFAGARSKTTRGDWIIEASEVNPNFIHVAGIDSPGLAGSPAIAQYVVQELLKDAGLKLRKNRSFNPHRAPMIVPKNGWRGLKAGKFGNEGVNVVCKCERVTEAEVVDACHRSVPVDSTQGIRKRVRAGMGHCQGDIDNYDCEHRVATIIARELNLPLSAVGRRPWPATSVLPKRWLTKEEKEKLVNIE